MLTPGPWKVKQGAGVVADNRVGLPSDVELRFDGSYLVCETVTPDNAALIAIAPEMFKLLSEIALYTSPRLRDRIDALLGNVPGGRANW